MTLFIYIDMNHTMNSQRTRGRPALHIVNTLCPLGVSIKQCIKCN